ncbi:MAG TPA: alpha/beta fold hydrolase [Euzebyales bacterium]|nr:alpha/beta fold hydrolase [Euzebyales bacterium]
MTPVVVHGFAGDLNTWLLTTEKLSEGRTTYAVDPPGHGASGKDVSSFDEPVSALCSLLDALGVGRVHLVGHSMGGPCAARRRAPVRPGGIADADRQRWPGRRHQRHLRVGFIEAGRRRELKGVLQLLFADPDLVTRRLVDDVLRYKRKDGVDAALRALAAELCPEGGQALDLRPDLERLAIPVLVIRGVDDWVVPASHAQGLPDHVEVHVLDGQGHSPHMEAANDVNRLTGASSPHTIDRRYPRGSR